MSYQLCSKRLAGIFAVQSDTSSKVYKVDFTNVPPTCSCVAYAIARNRAGGKNHGGAAVCKHISSIYDKTCAFDSRKHGESMLPICPHCGEKLDVVEDSFAASTSTTPATPNDGVMTSPQVTPVDSLLPVQKSGSLLTKLDKKIVQLTGTVVEVDTFGGFATISVESGEIPEVGCKVRLVGTTN